MATELLTNPDFSQPGDDGLPAGWERWGPTHDTALLTIRHEPPGVRLEAPSRHYAVGGVRQTVTRLVAGQAYRLSAEAELDGPVFEYHTLTLRIWWLQGTKPLHPAGMLARGPYLDGRRVTFDDVLVAPPDCDAAWVEIEVKWPRGMSVVFRQVSLQPAAAPPARKVRLASAYLRPKGPTTADNLQQLRAVIEEAGAVGADALCLGEAVTSCNTGRSSVECAEPIPGPSTEFFGAAARDNNLWLVVGLTELDDGVVYNTAALLDRQGQLHGTYRKVHLPREEWRAGVTPAAEWPVFETEFGCVGIQICYDWFFAEATAALAHNGAEVVFAPTWGNTRPDQDGVAHGETVFRVRARDNGVVMVPSVYDGRSLVIDRVGRILAAAEGEQTLCWADYDLAERETLNFVGHWRSIGPRDRMPWAYGDLFAGRHDCPDPPEA